MKNELFLRALLAAGDPGDARMFRMIPARVTIPPWHRIIWISGDESASGYHYRVTLAFLNIWGHPTQEDGSLHPAADLVILARTGGAAAAGGVLHVGIIQ